jgi:phosphoglycerol transferase MdoB-like AlkP superfamily enzyme
VAVAGAVVFTIAVAFELSRAFDWVVISKSLADLTRPEHRVLTDYWPNLVLAFAALLVWLLAASVVADSNKFSLHAHYRNRLVRAYLGASNNKRSPNAFHGFRRER